ncbi:endonuclease domain-containing protein [Streptomyces sp. NPDC127117]|uniref:endonuclease domain-containing protein n=1 Tax=Streptomyces sp. NPDC127117 TaxID=3345368 RepID=UPI00362A03FE
MNQLTRRRRIFSHHLMAGQAAFTHDRHRPRRRVGQAPHHHPEEAVYARRLPGEQHLRSVGTAKPRTVRSGASSRPGQRSLCERAGDLGEGGRAGLEVPSSARTPDTCRGAAYESVRRTRRADDYPCRLCTTPQRAYYWDHCHDHGLVRGPVCASCNTFEGNGMVFVNRPGSVEHLLECTICRAQHTLPRRHHEDVASCISRGSGTHSVTGSLYVFEFCTLESIPVGVWRSRRQRGWRLCVRVHARTRRSGRGSACCQPRVGLGAHGLRVTPTACPVRGARPTPGTGRASCPQSDHGVSRDTAKSGE